MPGRRPRPAPGGPVSAPLPEAGPLPVRRGPLAPAVLLAAARRPWAVRPGSLAGSLLPAGRTSTEGISRGLQRLHGHDWPAALWICTVRARDGQRVVFGSPGAPVTDVGTAVAASCAIPAYFSPVSIDGEIHLDGGMHSPTNADVVAADLPGLVLVSSPMTYARGGAEVVVLQPGPQDLAAMGLKPMQHARIEQVVATAAASTRACLEAQPELVARLS